MKHKKSSKNRLLITTSLVLIFSLISVFGLSLLTGNQQQSNIGTTLASTQEPADINSDSTVDIVDLSILLSNWGTTESLSDINNDNVVDIVDLSILLSKWGTVINETFQANCIDIPSLCGYPDETNTGVQDGITLTNSGSVTVTTNGAVVQNLNIVDGQIVVNANNVTIKNVKISGCTYYPIDYVGGKTGLTVMDTEIHSTCSETTAGMSFDNYTAVRVHVHGAADGFKANSNTVIQDSYIHDLWVTADSHNDGVQSTGGSNVTLRHNTIDTGTGGVCVQFGSSDSGWLVEDNLFHCTGWSLNGNSGTNNSSFINNRFAKVAGWYGPSGLGSSTNITWSGNYYDDNEEVVYQ